VFQLMVTCRDGYDETYADISLYKD
jgi:hypothetical protein